MKTDIEIAREATPLNILDIASKCDISEEFVENYGRYKAHRRRFLLFCHRRLFAWRER
jgi:formyltetrahydrofolate synthetase